MNLSGHRFTQNSNLRLQGFLSYQTNKDRSKINAYPHQKITKKSSTILVCLVGQKFLKCLVGILGWHYRFILNLSMQLCIEYLLSTTFEKNLLCYCESDCALNHASSIKKVSNFVSDEIICFRIVKVSKSQNQFFLKLHCPRNERNIWQNSALAS